MNDVAYSLSVGLAAVFAWAGVAKLRAPRPTARAFQALGVPRVLARVVPVVELALAGSLVVTPISAMGAVALLIAFTVVLLRADDGVRCACFGSASADPVSWVQILRNGLLAGAAVIASGATPVVPALAAVLTAAGIAAVSLLVLALAELKRTTGHVLAADLP